MSQAILEKISSEIRQCIDDCTDCHRVCVETISYCTEMGGKHANADHLRLLRDCAEICQTGANFMSRGSNLHNRVCAVCAEICELCAKECDKFKDDDKMRICAEVCRRCAESCRSMAGAIR